MDDNNLPGVVSIDSRESKIDKIKEWIIDNKKVVIAVAAVVFVLIAGGVTWALVPKDEEPEAKAFHQVTQDVVPKRDFLEGSQSDLPEAKVIKGHGRGTITTVDNAQNGKEVSAPIVGIDGVGGDGGATLAPPKNISQVGYYVRSSPFGVDGHGSSVITSHINYNGITGYGSIFTSLKKGDPITITTDKGKEVHYVVTQDPVNVSKSSPEYVKQTMNTINKMKGKNILVMVTCGGQFLGPNSPLGYADNIVVTAEPVEKSKIIKDYSKEDREKQKAEENTDNQADNKESGDSDKK